MKGLPSEPVIVPEIEAFCAIKVDSVSATDVARFRRCDKQMFVVAARPIVWPLGTKSRQR